MVAAADSGAGIAAQSPSSQSQSRSAENMTSPSPTRAGAADLASLRLFSHPNAKLGRFTIDRLMMILGKLDQDIEVIVTTCPHERDDLHPTSEGAGTCRRGRRPKGVTLL